ncbi:hypothetical protein MARBORIA2_14730 [Methanobrevibacter arboriphilus]|jgi:hypothetical protein|uniref:hypothetical protein n=1 Tax=Methanobrevibacter arboriphilus TaxID=39441 RepID=UPI0022EDB739|nr:hypothetical protein [Methanobrevibacter arboriphilus]GLI12383.1 hypothetical protein MARBORIA2_14730 [Methanobrevibacter arboriphilus]
MKISELIIELTNTLSEHGDQEVIIEHDSDMITNFSDIGSVGILKPNLENNKYIIIKK